MTYPCDDSDLWARYWDASMAFPDLSPVRVQSRHTSQIVALCVAILRRGK